MFAKIIAASALSLCIAGSAFAQASNTTGSTAMPTTMSGPIGDVFYSDAGRTTMRSETEIQTRYNALDAAQKEQLRADCAAMKAATGAETSNTSGSGTGAGNRDDTTTASMAQVCAHATAM